MLKLELQRKKDRLSDPSKSTSDELAVDAIESAISKVSIIGVNIYCDDFSL